MQKLPRLMSVIGVLAIVGATAAVSTASAGSTASGVKTVSDRDGTSIAELRARGYTCEKSDDSGKRGAAACFRDRGDEWYACDIHKRGSGTAYVQAGESLNPYTPGHERKTEEDNSSDGTSVPGDCDEGPEKDIDDGHYIYLLVCIAKKGDVLADTCDERWIEE